MPDGFTYTGGWQAGLFHGAGVATYSNGDVYDGLFENGKRQGQGSVRYSDGSEAAGDWVGGVLENPAEATE